MPETATFGRLLFSFFLAEYEGYYSLEQYELGKREDPNKNSDDGQAQRSQEFQDQPWGKFSIFPAQKPSAQKYCEDQLRSCDARSKHVGGKEVLIDEKGFLQCMESVLSQYCPPWYVDWQKATQSKSGLDLSQAGINDPESGAFKDKIRGDLDQREQKGQRPITVASSDAESAYSPNEGLTEQSQDTIISEISSPERGNTYADANGPKKKSKPKHTAQGTQPIQDYSSSNSDDAASFYGGFYAAHSPAYGHSLSRSSSPDTCLASSSSNFQSVPDSGSNNFAASHSGHFASSSGNTASKKDTGAYLSVIDLGSAFGQIRELNTIRRSGHDASKADLAKLQAFKAQLAALGYRLVEDDILGKTSKAETNFEPENTILSINLGHIQDHAGHNLYVGAIPGLGQGSDVESVEINGMIGSDSMFWGIDQPSAETYLVTWRSGDGNFLMTQGNAASIQAIVGEATYAALSDGQRIVPGNEQLVAEAKRLMAQVQAKDNGGFGSFMTFMESFKVHCLGFVQGLYNGASETVFGLLHLASLLTKAGPYVLSGQALEDIGRTLNDIQAAIYEVSQLSDEEFARFRQELIATVKTQALAELEYLWQETKRLGHDPVQLGEFTFFAASLFVGVGEFGALRNVGVLSKAGARGLQGTRKVPKGRMPKMGRNAIGPSLDDLSRSAKALDNGELTAAGRSLTKHGYGARKGNSLFHPAKGNPAAINKQAQTIVDDILYNPKTTVTNSYRGRFGDTIEHIAPDGRGIVFDSNGKFLFFRE